MSSSFVVPSSTADDVSLSPETAHMNVMQNDAIRDDEILLLPSEPLFTSEISIEWGTLHPHKNVIGCKVPWSSKELQYIEKAIEELTAQRGELPKNVSSLITDRIFRDTNAHPIFHSHHTLDSTRVRWGIQAYQKKKEKERKEKLGIAF
jgi:hypothetical protein